MPDNTMAGFGRPPKRSITDSYPCPRCGAAAGEPCHTEEVHGEQMRSVTVIHNERIPTNGH